MDYLNKIQNNRYLKKLNQLTEKEGYKNICFHGGNECTKDIIDAHTIQEEKYLREISDNGIVKCLRFKDFKPYFEDVGIARATIFKGFCSHHDNKIFRPIEERDYVENNIEQEFLFVYRALAKKYYELRKSHYHFSALKRFHETGNLKELKEFIKHDNIDEVKVCQELLKEILPRLKITQYELNILEEIRKSLTSRLDNKQYYVINTCRVLLNSAYGLVCSDCLYLDNDIDGKTINTRKYGDPLYPSFLTIIPHKDKTYILLSYLKKHRHIFDKLTSHISCASESELKVLFSNIIIRSCETVCFSPALWQSYGENKQQYYTKVYQEENKFNNLVSNIDPEINLFVKK